MGCLKVSFPHGRDHLMASIKDVILVQFSRSLTKRSHVGVTPQEPTHALSLLPSPFSLLPSPFSFLPSPFSLLPSPFSLLPSPFSLLLSPFSLLPSPFSLLPAIFLHTHTRTQPVTCKLRSTRGITLNIFRCIYLLLLPCFHSLSQRFSLFS